MLNVDADWCIVVLALNLEESLVKKKLLELSVDANWLKDQKYYTLVKKVSELIEKNENRRVSLDILLSQGYRNVRNKIDHEGFQWKPTKDETRKIVTHLIGLGKELWLDFIDKSFS